MIDFLRANPFVSREEYMWGMTIPQITLASMDFTRVEYKKEKKEEKNSGDGYINDKVAQQPKSAEEFIAMFKK